MTAAFHHTLFPEKGFQEFETHFLFVSKVSLNSLPPSTFPAFLLPSLPFCNWFPGSGLPEQREMQGPDLRASPARQR